MGGGSGTSLLTTSPPGKTAAASGSWVLLRGAWPAACAEQTRKKTAKIPPKKPSFLNRLSSIYFVLISADLALVYHIHLYCQSEEQGIYLVMPQKQRTQIYQAFLSACQSGNTRLQDLIHLGQQLMRQEKLYHHFFADHSLRAVAAYLAFFSLKLPYHYDNPDYLNRILREEEAKAILALYERRIAERIPTAYLTQEAIYLGRSFYVNENVLVPRSLMNTRFEEFLARVPWENNRVLDLCAGSGCIGITLALLDPKLKVDLADISENALEVAAINVRRFGLEHRVTCLQSDLFSGIQGKYDLIITNPPYVSDQDYQGQPAEIKNEPALALRGGLEGLDLVNRILLEARDYLNPQGLLIAEVGYEAARRLKWRYPRAGLQGVCSKKPAKPGRRGLLETLARWSDLPFEWLGLMDGVVLCKRAGLPFSLSRKNYPIQSWIMRTYRFLKTSLLALEKKR